MLLHDNQILFRINW